MIGKLSYVWDAQYRFVSRISNGTLADAVLHPVQLMVYPIHQKPLWDNNQHNLIWVRSDEILE